jgi:hypothetical protein
MTDDLINKIDELKANVMEYYTSEDELGLVVSYDVYELLRKEALGCFSLASTTLSGDSFMVETILGMNIVFAEPKWGKEIIAIVSKKDFERNRDYAIKKFEELKR